jgi:hypothetical protein
VSLQCVLTSAFECSLRTHAGCVRTQAQSKPSLPQSGQGRTTP